MNRITPYFYSYVCILKPLFTEIQQYSSYFPPNTLYMFMNKRADKTNRKIYIDLSIFFYNSPLSLTSGLHQEKDFCEIVFF